MQKKQSSLDFKGMKLLLWFRDLFRPRGNVLKEVGIRPGFQVLDFGCGPGGYLLPLAKLVGSEGRIYALDVHPLALESVRAKAARNHLENVETILADGPTGLPNRSLDVVLLYDVLHHLEAPNDVLKEFHRILKDDGMFSMSDHHMQDEDIIAAITASGLFDLHFRGESVFNFRKVSS